MRERILIRFSLGVSFAVLGEDVVMFEGFGLLNVTDLRRVIVPGVLRIPAFEGLDGDA